MYFQKISSKCFIKMSHQQIASKGPTQKMLGAWGEGGGSGQEGGRGNPPPAISKH